MNVIKMTIRSGNYMVEDDVILNPTFIPRLGDRVAMIKSPVSGTVDDVWYDVQGKEVIVQLTW